MSGLTGVQLGTVDGAHHRVQLPTCVQKHKNNFEKRRIPFTPSRPKLDCIRVANKGVRVLSLALGVTFDITVLRFGLWFYTKVRLLKLE